VVVAIDQSILLLSILQLWNLAHNILECGPGSILIIMSCCFMDIEKRGNGLQVTHTA